MDARKNAGKKKPAPKKMKVSVEKVEEDADAGVDAFMRDTANIDNDLNKFGSTIALQKKKEKDDEELRQEALLQQQYLQATYFNEQKPKPQQSFKAPEPEPEPEPEIHVEKFLPQQQLQFDNSKFRKGASDNATASSPKQSYGSPKQSYGSPMATGGGYGSPSRKGPVGFQEEEPEPMMADVDLDGYLDSDDENAMDNILNGC